MPTAHRIHLGKTGEDLACWELVRRGYAILDRRYRTRAGEVDIIARDGATIVFVEVKARRTRRFGLAAEAVTPRKQQKLCAMAVDYLARKRLADSPCRFDVVAVEVAEGGKATIEVIRGAF